MSDHVLVIGSEGLIGSRFVELYPQKDSLHTPRYIDFDIANPSHIKALMKSFNFSAIVNFAAFTDVDAAEAQRGNKKEDCWMVNVVGIKNLVSAIDPKKTFYIHISTDCVFSGSSSDPGPYPESYPPETNSLKLTWYGFTKKEGEGEVKKALGDSAAIVRINYPVRSKFDQKLDYLRKPLALFDEGKLYPLFTDQQISISFIDEVCQAIEKIIDKKTFGIFHVSSRDTSTPFELFSYMLFKIRGVKNDIEGITLDEFIEKTGASSARYPKYGGLKVEETEKKLGIKFLTWREIVDRLVEQGLGNT